MSNRRNVLQERFFNHLISGNREGAREIVSQAIDENHSAEIITSNLFWPSVEMLQNLRRNDQLSALSFNYGTRLLRGLVDQMQLRLEKRNVRDEVVLLVCGEEESEELAAQMASDLLEADGYKVYFAGGGVANDEIVEQLGDLKADKLVMFGAIPATVPQTRLLIDRLHEIGVCPQVQIIVGGGVFNRADGLAEEIGADLWAKTPSELVQVMGDRPERRMTEDQRTVGRKRRNPATTEAA